MADSASYRCLAGFCEAVPVEKALVKRQEEDYTREDGVEMKCIGGFCQPKNPPKDKGQAKRLGCARAWSFFWDC